jgi:electron transfer flavoprotein alpha subunit
MAVSTHVSCDISCRCRDVNVRPGGFSGSGREPMPPAVRWKTNPAMSATDGRPPFLEVVEAEVGDVDITKSDVLVSVGRGIEDEENIEIAQELAEAMGAVVSCSRPIVDAKWLEKSRQVGTSGQTVKPKVYMACGISGSFPASGRYQGCTLYRGHQQKSQGPHLSGGRRGHRGRHPRFPARTDRKNNGRRPVSRCVR